MKLIKLIVLVIGLLALIGGASASPPTGELAYKKAAPITLDTAILFDIKTRQFTQVVTTPVGKIKDVFGAGGDITLDAFGGFMLTSAYQPTGGLCAYYTYRAGENLSLNLGAFGGWEQTSRRLSGGLYVGLKVGISLG